LKIFTETYVLFHTKFSPLFLAFYSADDKTKEESESAGILPGHGGVLTMDLTIPMEWVGKRQQA